MKDPEVDYKLERSCRKMIAVCSVYLSIRKIKMDLTHPPPPKQKKDFDEIYIYGRIYLVNKPLSAAGILEGNAQG